MRVCFVLPSLRPSGGVAVAVRHARELRAAHDVDAELVVLGPGGEDLEDVPVRTLAEARERSYDVGVSTWWETAAPMAALGAERRCVLLQSFEQRFYDRDAPFERLSAEATLALGADFVSVSEWMRDLLAELRPGVRCHVVRPGVDKDVFGGGVRESRDGPIRILIEGQPSLHFKGVTEALAAVRAMSEPVHSTLVALDPESAGEAGVDRVLGGLDAEGMAGLYRESDVLVKLSRVEGLGLAPVEGFHAGLPCVVTPYTGHGEYVRHGENGLVVGFDDVKGTTAALDLLARDRALLSRLSDGALASAAEWPSTEESTAELHRALTEIVGSEPASPSEPLLRRTLELGAELGRARLDRHRAATEDALTGAESLVRELSASRDECGELLKECQGALAATRAELERIQSSAAYRLGRAAKRAGRRVTGR